MAVKTQTETTPAPLADNPDLAEVARRLVARTRLDHGLPAEGGEPDELEKVLRGAELGCKRRAVVRLAAALAGRPEVAERVLNDSATGCARRFRVGHAVVSLDDHDYPRTAATLIHRVGGYGIAYGMSQAGWRREVSLTTRGGAFRPATAEEAAAFLRRAHAQSPSVLREVLAEVDADEGSPA